MLKHSGGPQRANPAIAQPLTEALHAMYGPDVAIRATVARHCGSRSDIPRGPSGSEGIGWVGSGASPVKHFFLLNERARTWLGAERSDDAIYAACMKAVGHYSREHTSRPPVPITPKDYPKLFVWPCFGRPCHDEPTHFEQWRGQTTLPESYSDRVFSWTERNVFSLTRREAKMCDLEASRRVVMLYDSLDSTSGPMMFEMSTPEGTLAFFQRMVELQREMGERIPKGARVELPSLEDVRALFQNRDLYLARFAPFERISMARNLYYDSFYEAAGRTIFEKLCETVFRKAAPGVRPS